MQVVINMAPRKKTETEKPRQLFAELPASLDIVKIGRPSKYDPTFCDLVIELGAEGKSKAQIAAALGISRETLNQWKKSNKPFSDALKTAHDLALSWWETAGQMNMTRQGFNATAYIFQMKNRFREDYNDASVVDHSVNVTVTHVRDQLSRKLGRLALTGEARSLAEQPVSGRA